MIPALSMRSPQPLRTRAFFFACWLFGVALPDQQLRSARFPWLDAAARIVVAVLFALLASVAIVSMGDFANDFMRGWYAATTPEAPQIARWELPRSLVFGLLVLAWALLHSQLLKRAVAYTVARLDAERERANAREIAATLRLLQAQIEPHFLFNTLGAVQHLAEQGAPQAAALTADLIAFLRATANNLRADTTTLGDDCAACEAYLHIMQTRLRQRLQYSVDCPAELRSLRLPTALLLTLLENAIKHGIEPLPEGGQIVLRAEREGDVLQLTVADTGAGFGDDIGQGLGLQHIRERLALAYHGKASLSLEENAPRGALARISLPVSA